AIGPNGTRSTSRTPVTIGKSMGAGNDATIWTTGCSRRDQTAERPIRIPTGRVQAAARARAENVLTLVAPTAPAGTTHFPAGTRTRSPKSFHAPRSAAASAAIPSPETRAARTRSPAPPGTTPTLSGGAGGAGARGRRRLRRRIRRRKLERRI